MMNHKHRLLLITDTFPPAFAPRPGYLCKWFTREAGWQVVVIRPLLGREGDYSNSFGYLSGYATAEFAFKPDDGIHGSSISSLFCQWRRKEISTGSFFYAFLGKILYHIVHRTLDCSGKLAIRNALKTGAFDLIICCTTANGVHRLGDWASRKFHLPIIQDLRDIEEQVLPSIPWWKWRERLNRSLRNRILLRSDAVVVAVPSMGEDLKKTMPLLKYHVIYNGYDPDVFGTVMPTTTETFNIVYIGTVREKMIESFFRGLRKFVETAERAHVRMDFYATEKSYKEFVLPYLPGDLKDVVRNCPCVNQEQLTDVFKTASVLLILGHGLKAISTKTFEYMASARPIVAYNYTRDDDQSLVLLNSKNAQVLLSETELSDCFKRKYEEWLKYGVTASVPVGEEGGAFSRANEACRYLDIFNQIKREHGGTQ